MRKSLVAKARPRPANSRLSQSYSVQRWLKDREALETLADYATMLRAKPRLREEFATIYHDRYGKTYGLPRKLIYEILAQ